MREDRWSNEPSRSWVIPLLSRILRGDGRRAAGGHGGGHGGGRGGETTAWIGERVAKWRARAPCRRATGRGGDNFELFLF